MRNSRMGLLVASAFSLVYPLALGAQAQTADGSPAKGLGVLTIDR